MGTQIKSKKALFLCYIFPPAAQMASYRIGRFLEHLQKAGWNSVVITPKINSKERNVYKAKLGDSVTVIRTPNLNLPLIFNKIVNLFHIEALLKRKGHAFSNKVKRHRISRNSGKKLAIFLNKWVMIPDKCLGWLPFAVYYAIKTVRRTQIDVIYATGAPYTTLLAALIVSKLTGKKCICEFRDIWFNNPYSYLNQPTRIHKEIISYLERSVVRNASRVVCLSNAMKKLLVERYPDIGSERYEVLYSCYSKDDFDSGKDERKLSNNRFIFCYIGTLYEGRNVEVFFKAFSNFISNRRINAASIGAVFVGQSQNEDLLELSRKYSLTDYVSFKGFIEPEKIYKYMRSSSVLIIFQGTNDYVHVPGKLFDYIGSRKPILSMCHTLDVKEIIGNLKQGISVDPDDESAIYDALNELYYNWERYVTISGNDDIEEFEAQQGARKLGMLLINTLEL